MLVRVATSLFMYNRAKEYMKSTTVAAGRYSGATEWWRREGKVCNCKKDGLLRDAQTRMWWWMTSDWVEGNRWTSRNALPQALKCRLCWPCVLVTPVCRFGDSLVATLRLISQNKHHFHHQSHPYSHLLKETNYRTSTIICTDTTAVTCCAPKKG